MHGLTQLQPVVCCEVGRQRQALLCLLGSVHVVVWREEGRVQRLCGGVGVIGQIDGIKSVGNADEPLDEQVSVPWRRTALLTLYLVHLLVREGERCWCGAGRCVVGGGGGGWRGGDRGGGDRERGNLPCTAEDAVLVVFPVQLIQPEGERLPVLLREGGVNESEGEKLPTLVHVLLGLARTEEHFGQEFHVLLPGVGVPRVEERKVGEELVQSLVLCQTV